MLVLITVKGMSPKPWFTDIINYWTISIISHPSQNMRKPSWKVRQSIICGTNLSCGALVVTKS